MTRFVDPTDLRKVDLGNGDWIKVPSRISYGELTEVGDLKSGDAGKITALLSKVIKEWNLTDADGKGVGISVESIKRLDIGTVKQIAEAITPMFEMEKKVSTISSDA